MDIEEISAEEEQAALERGCQKLLVSLPPSLNAVGRLANTATTHARSSPTWPWGSTFGDLDTAKWPGSHNHGGAGL